MAAHGQGRRRPPPRRPDRGDVELSWTIRPLRPEDLPRYRPLRLRALKDHPEAFGSSFEEEQSDDMVRMIGSAPNVTLGGFAGDDLVGAAGFIVSPRIKQRHKGHVVGVYVAPEWRSTGLARGLIEGLVQQARHQGLMMLTLTVTTGNIPARRLYRALGFTTYGVEPNALIVDGTAWDEELMVLTLSRPA